MSIYDAYPSSSSLSHGTVGQGIGGQGFGGRGILAPGGGDLVGRLRDFLQRKMSPLERRTASALRGVETALRGIEDAAASGLSLGAVRERIAVFKEWLTGLRARDDSSEARELEQLLQRVLDHREPDIESYSAYIYTVELKF